MVVSLDSGQAFNRNALTKEAKVNLLHAQYFDYDYRDLEAIEMTMEEFEQALKEYNERQEVDILIE